MKTNNFLKGRSYTQCPLFIKIRHIKETLKYTVEGPPGSPASVHTGIYVTMGHKSIRKYKNSDLIHRYKLSRWSNEAFIAYRYIQTLFSGMNYQRWQIHPLIISFKYPYNIELNFYVLKHKFIYKFFFKKVYVQGQHLLNHQTASPPTWGLHLQDS